MSKAMQLVLIGLVALVTHQPCLAEDCKFTSQRDAALEVAGAKRLEITARAGDLVVEGRAGASRVEASGLACASSQALLDGIVIDARREGDVLHVDVRMPDREQFERNGSYYTTLDLRVSLPETLPVTVLDSSGEAEITRVASAKVTDSSGDLRIRDVTGDLQVSDSSGELTIRNVGGNVHLNDSSGDVTVDQVRGAVDVESDSSGDLHIARVTRDVRIQQDGSGGIRIADVDGSVVIGSDGSGDVDVRRVKGGFELGRKGSGDVRQADVQGVVKIDR